MFAFSRAMRRATKLTRKGRLAEATAVIQSALSSPSPPSPGKAKRRPTKPIAKRPAAKRASPKRSVPKRAKPGPSLTPTVPAALARPAVRARVKRDAPTPPVPPGALYGWRTHSGPHGSRRYRLYVPAALPSGPRPLLVMLHGCTQGADDFALGTRVLEAAERHGLIVTLPEQTRSHNAMACWNWFEPAHQGAGRGEPAILAGIVGAITKRHAIDPARIFAAGLSAGGAMAAVLGATAPSLFAAIGVHSGLPHGAAGDLSSAMRAMRSGARRVPAIGPRADAPRLFVVHGTADGTVSPRNADRLIEALGRADASSERRGRTKVTTYMRDGRTIAQDWRIAGLGHAWSGGAAGASYTAPDGPDVTEAMLRFFLAE